MLQIDQNQLVVAVVEVDADEADVDAVDLIAVKPIVMTTEKIAIKTSSVAITEIAIVITVPVVIMIATEIFEQVAIVIADLVATMIVTIKNAIEIMIAEYEKKIITMKIIPKIQKLFRLPGSPLQAFYVAFPISIALFKDTLASDF